MRPTSCNGDAFPSADNSVMLAAVDGTFDADGLLTFEYSDITTHWAEGWTTPDWFTLTSDGLGFQISEVGFYNAHVLFVVGLPDPVPTDVVQYMMKIGPSDGAYISEAWNIGMTFLLPVGGGFSAVGLGEELTFDVVAGPGSDPSHRPGLEVNDVGRMTYQIQNWTDGAKAVTILGGTVHIKRVG